MTWYSFQRQFDAVDPDKGDGYSPSDFAEMSKDELTRARAMMLARALDGDDADLSGLRYIGDAATVTALEAAKDSGPARRWDYDIKRLDVLFTLTGGEVYLAALSRFETPSAGLKGWIGPAAPQDASVPGYILPATGEQIWIPPGTMTPSTPIATPWNPRGGR